MSRIGSALEAPYRLGGEEVHVSTAIGLATTDDAHADPFALIRSADESMFRVKRLGANERGRMTA